PDPDWRGVVRDLSSRLAASGEVPAGRGRSQLSGGTGLVGAGGLAGLVGLVCARGVRLAMAGARRGRRKPGQDDLDGNGQLLDEGHGSASGLMSDGATDANADLDADQWLTPFRAVQSIRPAVSQRGAQTPAQQPVAFEPSYPSATQPAQAPPMQPPPVQPPP